jgi:hypothetical protein
MTANEEPVSYLEHGQLVAETSQPVPRAALRWPAISRAWPSAPGSPT